MSLFGYDRLAAVPRQLSDPDLSTADNKVVVVRLEPLGTGSTTAAGRVDVTELREGWLPPAGSWVDQAVVIWVLIGLATALVLYVMAWHRQGD
ncbi:DUF4436 family protein [Mycobacterium asiaticum]|uniref:Uncharacterized protein n=1 Tax=Mycobacterium asiaticum TaxID=1790 RepID=A0A1A3BSR7_MYCAS|nr:hypothetical protein A9X01_28100 [Mycobacterium asiaticum]